MGHGQRLVLLFLIALTALLAFVTPALAEAPAAGKVALETDGPLFTLSNLFTLLMLILLQAVLGFDNLLYISLESQKAPPESQAAVRRWGIGIALALRIVFLFFVMQMFKAFDRPLFRVHTEKGFDCDMTLHALVVLAGGVFLVYTAVKEIFHMLSIEELDHADGKSRRSDAAAAITWIVLMNLVFSFDSILSALALTKNFYVMAAAIVISGVMMLLLADRVANFLKKNRMYEVLGLFILLIVGVMLLAEGGHLSKLKFFDYSVEPMTKTTFYFVIGVLVVIDIVQGRYRKKLLARREQELAKTEAPSG